MVWRADHDVVQAVVAPSIALGDTPALFAFGHLQGEWCRRATALPPVIGLFELRLNVSGASVHLWGRELMSGEEWLPTTVKNAYVGRMVVIRFPMEVGAWERMHRNAEWGPSAQVWVAWQNDDGSRAGRHVPLLALDERVSPFVNLAAMTVVRCILPAPNPDPKAPHMWRTRLPGVAGRTTFTTYTEIHREAPVFHNKSGRLARATSHGPPLTTCAGSTDGSHITARSASNTST